MAGAINTGGLGSDMATCAKLAVQLAGEVVQFSYRFGRKQLAIGIELLLAMGCVLVAILPFPGQLRVADHTGSGVHQIAFHPLKLILVAGGAAIFPALDILGIVNAKNALMRFFLPLFDRIAAMAGNTVIMGFGDLFDTFMTTNAGGLFCSTLTAGQEH